MIPRPSFLPRPLSLVHPALHPLALWLRRSERGVAWRIEDARGARRAHAWCRRNLTFRVKKHQSVLVRRYATPGPAGDLQLQLNKVENLRRVVDALDGVILRPGEQLSFWRLVGRPTRERGFLPGMELSRGEARPGIGGGICQASNLIFWLALHSELRVRERHHHSFDPFPDQGRVLPWASGATVMWNYRDLVLENQTSSVFQLRLWLGRKCLHGDLRADVSKRRSFSVFERHHRFVRVGERWFRENELWRRVIDVAGGGATIGQEFLYRNHGEVKYDPVGAGTIARRHLCATPRVAVQSSGGRRE